MTRKDFQNLADHLRQEKPNLLHLEVQWLLDVKAVATACATTNANFDYTRFYAACGIQLTKEQL